MNFLVLRPPMVPSTFLQKCKYLQENTTYLKGEYQKDLAPEFTDCLTAIAWIFKECTGAPQKNSIRMNSIGWELTWIGNMPRKLLTEYQFDIAQGSSPGDLIFFSNRKGITKHVGVFVTANDVFHCSEQAGRAVIENIRDIFARRYQQSNLPIHYEITNPVILLTQTDPRTDFPPQTFTTLKKNKKAENKCVAEQVQQTGLIINYNISLNPQFLSLTPYSETQVYPNSVLCNRSTLEFIPPSISMDCSANPPNTPPFTSTGYASNDSISSISVSAG